MPLKCAFCQEESVVEEDVGDGREQLICVECGAVASQLSKPVPCTYNSTLSADTTFQEIDDSCDTDMCQSCGDNLQPGEFELCSECKSLEQEQKEKLDISVKENGVNNQTAAAQKENVSLPTTSNLPTCSSCGSSDIVVDELGTEEQTVCKSCGHVIGKQVFTTNESDISSTRTFGNRIQTLPMFARRQGQSESFKMGIEKISMVQQKLALPHHIKEEAVDMFERVFYLQAVVYRSLRIKEHIATACVYIACRRDSLPVSIIHFQDFRDSHKLFSKAIKMVTTLLNIKLLPPALGTQVRQIFHSINLGVGNADSAKMLNQVRDIMFLCRDAWLTSGRRTQPMISLAIYYVFRNCNDCPRQLSLNKFCSLFKFPPIGKKLRSDFQKLFLHLAFHLPWAKQDQVRHSTIHLFIDDILQYKKSLLHLAFQKPELGEECAPWEVKPETKPEVNGGIHFSDSPTSPPEMKKPVLLPACFKRVREAEPVARAPEPVIPAHLDLDCTEIKPTDFSEVEISSYIRTSAELDSIKEAKEKVFREKKPRLK